MMLVNKLYFMIHLKYRPNKRNFLIFFLEIIFIVGGSFNIQILLFVRRRAESIFKLFAFVGLLTRHLEFEVSSNVVEINFLITTQSDSVFLV